MERENQIKQRKNIKVIKCNNCGESGHLKNTCDKPIVSWGMILLYKNEKDILVMFSSRKYSLGYTELIRGRYDPNKILYVITLINQMYEQEVNEIENNNYCFKKLWNKYWNLDIDSLENNSRRNSTLINEYNMSKEKYDILLSNNDKSIFKKNLNPDYQNIDYGFPKGKKQNNETGKECAVRELFEETGYSIEMLNFVENVKPLEETIIGTNGILYKHVYYLAIVDKIMLDSTNNEIGELIFVKLKDAHNYVREYRIDRLKIIKYIQELYNDEC